MSSWQCPNCGSSRSRVVDAPDPLGQTVITALMCLDCGQVDNSWEAMDVALVGAVHDIKAEADRLRRECLGE